MLRTISQKFDSNVWKRKIIWVGIAAVAAISLIAFTAEIISDSINSLAFLIPWSSLGGALFIVGLRLADVPIGTLKTVLMVRGMRTWATILGLIEVTVWITAIGKVMGHLDNPWNIAGYALGYSAGTWLGMWIENRLAFGSVEVHTISMTRSDEVADAIRAFGYGVTQFQALGQSGPVCIVGTIAERKHLDGLLNRIREVDASAFVTVDETKQVLGGYRLGK
ncbi:MAG: DUF5698 domain-containing protein [Anaerolineales bacterium]|nr:MAG: DUF5698 domain-containing protein [Anaerolineales bacterium]